MKIGNFTTKAIIVSIIYSITDSFIHYYIYLEKEFEFIPSETNEFWMRFTIITLFILFGAYADKHSIELIRKEKEKRIIFNATVTSTQHILNNLLNQMQYFKIVAEEAKAFDKDTTELYENTIKEGKELVDKLSSVEELTKENIFSSVSPKPNKEY